MKELKFKTDINCDGCLATVSPFLVNNEGVQNWEVDLQSKDRVLKVETENLSVEDVQQIINQAGFKAEVIG
jgi:copper chaperone